MTARARAGNIARYDGERLIDEIAAGGEDYPAGDDLNRSISAASARSAGTDCQPHEL